MHSTPDPAAPSPWALLRHGWVWGGLLVSWLGLAALWGAVYTAYGVSPAGRLGMAEAAGWILVCAGGAASGWALPPQPSRASLLRTGAAILVVALVLLVARNVLVRYAVEPLAGVRVPRPSLLAAGILRHLPTVASFVAAGHAVRRALRHRHRQVALARFEAEVAAARLQAARARLRPRFLVEVLDGIAGLAHRDVRTADRLLLRLSELLRAALQDGGADTVYLGREVDFVRLFLEVGRARTPAMPLLEVQADVPLLRAAVPHRAVFRLVESTLALLEAGGSLPTRVRIRADADGAALRVRVRDDAPVPLARRRALEGWAELREGAADGGGWRFSEPADGGVEATLLLPLPAGAGGR